MSLTPILQKIENTHPMGFHPLSNSRRLGEETLHSYWGNLRIASRSHRQIGQLSCNPLLKSQYRISCVAICRTHHIGYLLAVVGQPPYIVCNNLGSTYYWYYKFPSSPNIFVFPQFGYIATASKKLCSTSGSQTPSASFAILRSLGLLFRKRTRKQWARLKVNVPLN